MNKSLNHSNERDGKMRKEQKEWNIYADRLIMDVRSFEEASGRAYADMARRTLHLDESNAEKNNLKNHGTDCLKSHIDKLAVVKTDQTEFDNWHNETCRDLIALYNDRLSYGQAQKWVNMLLKYLYAYDVQGYQTLFTEERIRVLHMPIDSIIISRLHKDFSLQRPENGWSKLNEQKYMQYQKDIRQKLKNVSSDNKDETIPFYWELIHWERN